MGIHWQRAKIMITNFLSSRTNLTIFQCMLYGIIGYVMGSYLGWIELGIMFILLFGIQFITRVKSVSDGIMFGHLMKERNMETNEILQRMKDEVDKLEKDKWD